MRVHYSVYVVVFTLCSWAASVPDSGVFATHENDHRYLVEGHITDSNGSGIPNTKVFVRAEVLETGVTSFSDQAGFYSALLHLHDADAGTAVTVTALGTTEQITAGFDPADKTTPRKGVVDIVHAVPMARNASGGSDTGLYLTWGLVALAAGVSVGLMARKRIRRRKAQSA